MKLYLFENKLKSDSILNWRGFAKINNTDMTWDNITYCSDIFMVFTTLPLLKGIIFQNCAQGYIMPRFKFIIPWQPW